MSYTPKNVRLFDFDVSNLGVNYWIIRVLRNVNVRKKILDVICILF